MKAAVAESSGGSTPMRPMASPARPSAENTQFGMVGVRSVAPETSWTTAAMSGQLKKWPNTP